MSQTEIARVGLYIKPATRNRLNLFKAKLSLARDTSLSQDDAINALLDRAGEEVAPGWEREPEHA